MPQPIRKSPAGWGGTLLALYVKEISLLNFLVVLTIVVPAALVDPLAVPSRVGQVLRSAASQQQQQAYSFHNQQCLVYLTACEWCPYWLGRSISTYKRYPYFWISIRIVTGPSHCLLFVLNLCPSVVSLTATGGWARLVDLAGIVWAMAGRVARMATANSCFIAPRYYAALHPPGGGG